MPSQRCADMNIRARGVALIKAFIRTARLMVGVPDYEVYVAHMRKAHPDREVMTWPEFVRERQDARYGGSKQGFRCC